MALTPTQTTSAISDVAARELKQLVDRIATEHRLDVGATSRAWAKILAAFDDECAAAAHRRFKAKWRGTSAV